jgi:hypothetical protein
MNRAFLRELAASHLSAEDRSHGIRELDRIIENAIRIIRPWIVMHRVSLALAFAAWICALLGFLLLAVGGQFWTGWTMAFIAASLIVALVLWLERLIQHEPIGRWLFNPTRLGIPMELQSLLADCANKTRHATYVQGKHSVPAQIFASFWAILLMSDSDAARKWVRPLWGRGSPDEICLDVAQPDIPKAVIVNLAVDQSQHPTFVDNRQQQLVIVQKGAPASAPVDQQAQAGDGAPAEQGAKPKLRRLDDSYWMVGLPYHSFSVAIDQYIVWKHVSDLDAPILKEVYLEAHRLMNSAKKAKRSGARPQTLQDLAGEVHDHLTAFHAQLGTAAKLPSVSTVESKLSTSDKHPYADFKAFITEQGVVPVRKNDGQPDLFS